MDSGRIQIVVILSLFFLLTLLAASPVPAQAVYGSLLESGTETPVVEGKVVLLDAEGRSVASATSDQLGAFAFHLPSAGAFRLRAERSGHGTVTSELLTVRAHDSLKVVLRVPTDSTEPAPLTVHVPERWRAAAGRLLNAERRDRGMGVFFHREEILGRVVDDVREAFRDVEGTRVWTGRGPCERLDGRRGSGIEMPDGQCLESTMGWGCLRVVVDEQPLEPSLQQTRAQRTAILPRPREVAAVEFYRTVEEVPDLLQWVAWRIPGMEPCGVVAIWTLAAW